jgi:multiple sugar transport system permease protein
MPGAMIFTPYIFIGAGVIYLLVFGALPLIKGLDLSFTDTKLLNPNGGSYVGIKNYVELLTGEKFYASAGTTLVYTALTVIGSLLLGTVSAVVLNRAFPGRTFARAIMVIPWAVPGVAAVLVFRWIMNDSSGIANGGLNVLGIGSVGWLTDPDFGMLSVLIVTIWKVSPFVMLVVLAALQSVPQELYESTRVDGAGAYSTFRFVVLPHIMPTIRVVALLMTIWSFRRFEIIWLLTGGGPVDVTNTIVINVYREAFVNRGLGFSAAIGMLGLLLSLVITVLYFGLERRSESREES